MEKTICVYCSSSDKVKEVYFSAATLLGRLIAENNHKLMYGGGNVGLMNTIAKSVQDNKGHVIGVIPKALYDKKIAYIGANELIITENMRDRKAIMEENSSSFIALPGGFGTLEEVFEIITSKQLNFHNKPIVFLNTNDFYGKLFDQLEYIYSENFAKPEYRSLYHICSEPDEAISYICNYHVPKVIDKWF